MRRWMLQLQEKSHIIPFPGHINISSNSTKTLFRKIYRPSILIFEQTKKLQYSHCRAFLQPASIKIFEVNYTYLYYCTFTDSH